MNREAAAATAASVVPSELGVAPPHPTLMFFGFCVPFLYFMSIFVKEGKLHRRSTYAALVLTLLSEHQNKWEIF